MPTTYAHWRFGNQCIEEMPKDLKKLCLKYRNIFDIGVHGPDILFYDLTHKNIMDYGYGLHELSGRSFFENCKFIYNKETKDKDKLLVYILGFLTHYTLDSTCHSYVEIKKEVSDVSHGRIESDWDRHLIIKDERNLKDTNRSESIIVDKNNAEVISKLFPFSDKDIYRTIKMMKMILNFFYVKDEKSEENKTKLLNKLKFSKYADLFMGFSEHEKCRDSNLRLDKLYIKALDLFPKLLDNLMLYINNDIDKLDKYFDHGFDQWPDYKDIKVLDYEKELKYKIK